MASRVTPVISSATTQCNNPTTFRDITSHDLKLGLRWICCDVPAPVAVPVITKG